MKTTRVMITGAAAIAVVALLSGAGFAAASIPDPSGVIHACYQSPPPQHGANLQVIDTAAGGNCSGGQHQVTWNQTGPQGPQGEPGTAGYEIDTYTPSASDNPLGSTFTTANGIDGVQLYCPPDKVVLSGGWSQINPNKQNLQVLENYPFSDIGGSGERFAFSAISANSFIKVYVTCVSAS